MGGPAKLPRLVMSGMIGMARVGARMSPKQRLAVHQIDQRTDSFADVGEMYAMHPAFYLLAGPDCKGAAPKGIAKGFRALRVRRRTDLAERGPGSVMS